MKVIIFAIFFLCSIQVFAQPGGYDTADSLKVVKLPYNTLDSNAVKKRVGIKGNIVSKWYQSTNDEYLMFYYTNDKNQWKSFNHFPYDNPAGTVYIPSIWEWNIDGKRNPELIIEGFYPSFGDSILVPWMTIINIDRGPRQIFKVFYGCYYEDLSELEQWQKKGNEKEGEKAILYVPKYVFEYKREINVDGNGILILPDSLHAEETGLIPVPDLQEYDEENDEAQDRADEKNSQLTCRLTRIPGGVYVLKRGRIRKKR